MSVTQPTPDPAPNPISHRASRSPARRRIAIGVIVATVAIASVAAVVVVFTDALGPRQDVHAGGDLSEPSEMPSPSAEPSPTPTSDGMCNRQAGTSPRVTVTDVSVGGRVTGYGREGDTEPLPMAIAATPDGRSWLAWLGTDNRVYLGRLDCNDQLMGTPTSFEGIDLQDVHADANGGVVLLTRRGDCGAGRLCGGASDTTIRTGARSSHPHLVSYGTEHMLLAWESGSSMAAQVYEAGNGKPVGSQFTIGVRDHNYLAFKAYPDGSAAYPAAGADNTSVRIARVLPQKS